MSTRLQNRIGASSLVLLAVAFVIAVVVSNQLFKGLRIDLTENGLYTLSAGTKRIVRDIDEPINLYFFFSDSATESVPTLRDYANRVREMLEEFEDASRGGIRLAVIDPKPFSEEEDRAAQLGLEDVPLPGSADPVYFGLAGTNSVGDEEVIPFFQPDQQASLEYDIAKLVSTLANPDRIVVGLVSGVSMTGGFDPQTQRMQQPWVIYEQASQLFEIRDLGLSFEAVPDDVNLLWIVQPRNLSIQALYAIDQFVMQGGNAVIFVDPVAAADAAPAPQGMPQGMPPMGQSSDLPELFDGWGIGYDVDEVIADSRLALPISSGFDARPTRHYGYLGITPEQMNDDDIVSMQLSNVNAAMAGRLSIREDSEATFEPLLTSSAAAAMLAASRFSFLPDPSSLQQDFTPGGEPLVIAARISGTLASAFPDGKPVTEPTINTDAAESAAAEATTVHVARSAGPANLIVVADVDILSDRMWVQVQRFFGQQIASPFASNGAFAINALENLAGSADLIAVRSRGSFSRPFTKVEDLRAEAEARFLETEQRLQEELAETERRLAEIEATREDAGSLLLTDEQEAEIDRFIDQRASIRNELRAVQRGLDKDIEDLGTWLKVINIGLVPLLLTLGTLVVLWRRKRQDA